MSVLRCCISAELLKSFLFSCLHVVSLKGECYLARRQQGKFYQTIYLYIIDESKTILKINSVAAREGGQVVLVKSRSQDRVPPLQ